MNIADRLDDLRARHPGCVLVAFGDLGTRLMLRTSSDAALPQERLDRLCAEAAETFALGDLLALEEGKGDEALILAPGEARIMVRSGAGSADFLCCVCADETTHAAIVRDARDVLQEVSAVS